MTTQPRIALDDLTSDALDALYDRLAALEAEAAKPQTVCDGVQRPHQNGESWLRQAFDCSPVGGPRTSAASEKRPSGAGVTCRPPVREVGPLLAVPLGPANPVQDTQTFMDGGANDIPELYAAHAAITAAGGELTPAVHRAIDAIRARWDFVLRSSQRTADAAKARVRELEAENARYEEVVVGDLNEANIGLQRQAAHAEATVTRVRQAVDAGPVGSCCAHLIRAALNPPADLCGCGRPDPGPCQPCPDGSPSLHCACVCVPTVTREIA